ncbi:CotH kinase family protein [Methanofollis ethanolicus]|uniref:CotH kinase family protein n=1 Tax=Methanofollis ethanolicus TaxID=488124 RepID=UPI000832FA98|nr:CotH kinase family protein [Methanofollis ethanolicus]
MTGRTNHFFTLALCVLACGCCLLTCGCVSAGSADDAASGRSADWTEETHGDDVEPNYSVVFPEDTVNTITLEISPENWQTMLDDMTDQCGTLGGKTNRGAGGGDFDFDPVWVGADLTFDGLEWTDVGVRFKGQSTLLRTWQDGSYKLSFKLDFDHFEDENTAIKNQRFYGFDELNLKNGYNDDSLLRDRVVPEIFDDAGVVAPATAFYRVYVDYGEGPVYVGLYTLIESVEDTLIETQFGDDSGNVYKPEGTGATFAGGTFDTTCFEKKTNEKEENWSDVEELYAVLNAETRTTDPGAWREELESVFDVDTFVRWLAVSTVIQNWDIYGNQCKNVYLYTDPADGTITWIPWDNNEALPTGTTAMNGTPRGQGGFNGGAPAVNGTQMGPGGMQPFDGGGMGRALSLGLTEVGDDWPLIRYLMDDPVYYDMYLDALDETVSTAFEPSKMAETYQTYHDLIAPYVVGADGEEEGYTNLRDRAAFDTSVEALIEQAYSRHDAVMAFLSTEQGSNTTGVS